MSDNNEGWRKHLNTARSGLNAVGKRVSEVLTGPADHPDNVAIDTQLKALNTVSGEIKPAALHVRLTAKINAAGDRLAGGEKSSGDRSL